MLRTYINDGNYLWLLKPNSFNRGRGIQIFRTLDEMEKLIAEFCEGVDEKVFDHMEKIESVEKVEKTAKANKVEITEKV